MVLAVWRPELLTWALLPKTDFSSYLRCQQRHLSAFVPKELWGLFGFCFSIDSYVVFAAELLKPNPAQGGFK